MMIDDKVEVKKKRLMRIKRPVSQVGVDARKPGIHRSWGPGRYY